MKVGIHMQGNEKTLGYVRVVFDESGKVAHICPNTLHHPDPSEQERLQKTITVNMLDELFSNMDHSYIDCQVLVVFHEHNGQLTVAHSLAIQPKFKSFWRERITKKIEKHPESMRDEIHIQSRIDLWEETYKESFIPTRKIV